MDRSEKLTDLFPSLGCDSSIITSAENVFYLSGFTAGEDACLIITETERIIITDSRYTIQVKEESGEFEHILGSAANLKLISETLKRVGAKKIAFENKNMTVSVFDGLSELMDKAEFVPLGDMLTAVRSVKDSGEVLKIKEAF